MVVLTLLDAARPHLARRHVHLDADDRLDAGLFALLVELDRPVQRPVIGQRERAHPKLGDVFDERLDLRVAVEQRVLRMDVQMDEIRGHRPHRGMGTGVRGWGRGAPAEPRLAQANLTALGAKAREATRSPKQGPPRQPEFRDEFETQPQPYPPCPIPVANNGCVSMRSQNSAQSKKTRSALLANAPSLSRSGL